MLQLNSLVYINSTTTKTERRKHRITDRTKLRKSKKYDFLAHKQLKQTLNKHGYLS
jgi:hypothetical protein